MDGKGSKTIQIPQGWVTRRQVVRDGSAVATCNGCNLPNYCAGKGVCHRAQVFGELPKDGVDEPHV